MKQSSKPCGCDGRISGSLVASGPREAILRLAESGLPGGQTVFDASELPSTEADNEETFEARKLARNVAVLKLRDLRPDEELHAASKMLTALEKEIEQEQAIVSYDHALRYRGDLRRSADRLGQAATGFLAELRNTARDLVAEERTGAHEIGESCVLSGLAAEWAAGIRRQRQHAPRLVAMIDSGISPTSFAGRSRVVFDCSGLTPRPLGHVDEAPRDLVGHGTHVAAAFDAALDPGTEVVVAALGPEENVTASAAAIAILSIMAQASSLPAVINMSLWPYMESATRHPSLHQLQLVDFTMKTSAASTFAVVAAGNDGLRFELPAWTAPNLLYAVALDSKRRIAPYSSLPSDPDRAVAAFGGDNTRMGGIRFFQDHSEFGWGTSFAAPLVAAAAAAVPSDHVLCGCWTQGDGPYRAVLSH